MNASRSIMQKIKKAANHFKKYLNPIKKSLSIWFVTSRYMLQFEYFLTCFILTSIIFITFLSYASYKIQHEKVLHISDTHQMAAYPRLDTPLRSAIGAEAYIVYEPESRVVVAGKNIYFRFSPASTAKIISALIALETYSPTQTLRATGMDTVVGSKMGLVENEQMTVRNLLYGLLLPSGNDAAAVLAQNYPGGRTAFIQRMNTRAQELGLTNTYFVDPAGYEDENYTTPFDLARLTAVALKNPIFASTVHTKFIQVESLDHKIVHQLQNLNELLVQPDVTGVKTGFTNEAGGVLVTSAVRQNHTFIIIVMKSPDRFADSYTLLDNVVRQTNFVLPVSY